MQEVILITGASSGIGRATAIGLAKEGHKVYAAARRLAKMEDLKEYGIIPVEMDITKEEDLVKVSDQIRTEQGRLDVLVNNAGFGLYGAVEEITMEQARYQFDVNIFGLARLTQLVLPMMREQKSGKIINISSIGGKIYTPLGAWYHATKHALEGWSDCLRLEVEPMGIHVVIVEPGLIGTEFADVLENALENKDSNSPYKPLKDALVDGSKERYSKPGAFSPPEVIARTISKAIKKKKPKTRYAAGKMAKMILFIRRNFSDRFFDRLIMGMVK